MVADKNELSSKDIIEKLNILEQRITRLEAERDIIQDDEESWEEPETIKQLKSISYGSFFESKFGEYGLSWLGNIVLFIGIAFLVQYILNSGYSLFATIFGYASIIGIYVLAHFLKKTLPRMASIFNLNAWMLLFYITLRLHFFTAVPLVQSKAAGLVLLILATAFHLFFAIKKRSASLAGVGLLFLSVIAVVSDSSHFMLSTAVIIAMGSVLFLYRFGWIRLFYLSIFFVYTIGLIWFLNNPFMGHQLQAITIHHYGFIYLFIIGAVYSLAALMRISDSYSGSGIVGAIVMNGLGFSMLLALITISFFKGNYVFMIGSVSAYCLLYSVLLQIKSEWKITAALYALFGFITLSFTVHGIYDFPKAYFLLAFQSLLVVSMAIWFRSKFIVVMNTLLFIILLIFYLSTSSPADGVNISFSLVALLTARILNWKKDKLTIKTDLLRNIYLVTGFIMVLITLYHLVPARYITLSWTLAAVVYFLLSLVLKNVKYRYIALGTMIAAAFYLFIIDLARIGLIYRIMALMFLAIISIGLSVFYTRRSKRKHENE